MRLLNRPFIRGIEGDNLLEIFFVTAVASVLSIRFLLAITGYPQLSGGGLHIAHVLVGGLFMMLALIIALAYINKSASYVVAVLGGFGFGAFIDELGKFVTGDNNYFFSPTIALIYIIFVLIYLAVETFIRRPKLSEQERLVNVLEIAKEIALSDLDHREREWALKLLRECDPSDPVTRTLKDLLSAIEAIPMPEPDIYTACKIRAYSIYRELICRRWFLNSVVAFFVLQSLLTLAVDGVLLYLKMHSESSAILPIQSFSDLAVLASATLSALLAIAGILRIGILKMGIPRVRSSRLAAYRLFRNAILVQIFLTQVFLFNEEQLLALAGLAGNILVLLVLRYMINQEIGAQSVCSRQI